MTIVVEAVYEGGVFKPKRPPALDEGAEVSLTITGPIPAREIDGPPEASTLFEEDDPLAKVIGIWAGETPADGADRHDDYLYGRPAE